MSNGPTYYTLVSPGGAIVRSQFTTDPATERPEGHRLLPDAPPVPGVDYPVGLQRAVRIEPVPAAAVRVAYRIEPLPDDAVAAAVRTRRNAALTACDWTQLPDANVSRQAWAAYRQALRDVPEQDGFPRDVKWPEPPAA